jgi:hypothetical protein
VLGSTLPVIYGNGMRIVQNPGSVAISYEMIHDTRIITLDRRAHLDESIRQWMGNARPPGRRHARRRNAQLPGRRPSSPRRY